jgi:PadR family transcriptional regulator PadR
MIRTELVKGLIRSIVLKILTEHKRMYGYELTQKIEELSKGNIKLTFGSLYPILHRLEDDGLVKTEAELVNNRNRIYYYLTKKGQKEAAEGVSELDAFVVIIKNIVDYKNE